ncbi:DUF5057 domain-containing protein [Bacillus sp. M6-12]|uniref:DUF5057 domain-containing protein n=1 Tax=Bacillus sp. M6-12 TaxID=2054166 RepID=UPI000C791EAA|nr:DUF5057 domain-containing protein [Bacillus sp. M6-12]PLS16874.1 DUF5057 domain-containing protein [Bacillus sp. M6-12]
MKRVFVLIVSALIVLTSMFQVPLSLKANGNGSSIPAFNPKLSVLEIVDKGTTSQLKPIIGTSSFNIKTVPMKLFVAQREELDGQYDLIAIMEGNYTSKPVSGKNHNTEDVMNDITNLKAKEIIDDFINKGQPVIIDRVTYDSGNKLKANFKSYLNSKYVIDYNSNGNNKEQELVSHLKNFYNSANYKVRPRFTLSEQPSGSGIYKSGETLSFKMNVQVPSNPGSKRLKAQLYIDSDFNDRYDTEEIVAENSVTSTTATISYKLPKSYSGVRNWKLELVDESNNLKDYKKGMVKFTGEVVEIKVLQVTSNANSSSSLKKDSNMNQSFLQKSGEYKINIDVTDMGTFNSSIRTLQKDKKKYSHESINGLYDMVIFGFADSYNNLAHLGDNAVDSLEKFISSKQSIMFTHDTIFQTNNNWVDNFMDDTGQIAPQTDLGLGAPNTSYQTNKINDGLMTAYPFPLDSNVEIATTHNQYYTLNLEDPEVISWYNIIGSNRDVNDSWNHYYTYSKGNITYSGTGHTSSGFPREEQELFVNTMYRAFLGSNHAPVISVLSPEEGQTIPSNQNIELSYTMEDFDLRDKKLSTKVFLNDREVLNRTGIVNGETVVASIPHNMPEGGPTTIRIEATDEKGAVTVKEINVNIIKLNVILDVSREVKAVNPVKTNDNLTVTYTITPREVPVASVKYNGSNQITASSLNFTEKFPAGINVIGGAGSLQDGMTLNKRMENIVYKKVGNVYKADPVSFSISLKPTEKKQYVLNDSLLRYKDETAMDKTASFNPVTIVADVPLTAIEFPEKYILYKNSSKNFMLDLALQPQNAGIKEIVWSEESGGHVLSLNTATGSAAVLDAGSTKVKVRVTDVFGKVIEKEALVVVQIPVIDFTVSDLELFVGETKKLQIKVNPEEALSSLKIINGTNAIATVNEAEFTVTGEKAGTTVLTISGTDKDGNPIVKSINVTVKDKLTERIEVTPGNLNLDKHDIFDDFEVKFDPENAVNKDLEWTSNNPNIVRVLEDGKIEAVGTGRTEIIVSTSNGKTDSVTVTVGQPLVSIAVDPETAIIEKGETDTIAGYLKINPADATNIESIRYESSDDYYAEIDRDGTIYGNRIGTADITINVTDDAGKDYEAILKVKVVEPGFGGDGDSKY